MERRDWAVRGLSLACLVLVALFIYQTVQVNRLQKAALDSAAHFTRNVMVGIGSDVRMTASKLEDEGELNTYWLISARANLFYLHTAAWLYRERTGHSLFPTFMVSGMHNALGTIMDGKLGPQEQQLLRDLAADLTMLHEEIYPEEVLRRADSEELAAAYERLVASLRTPYRSDRP